MLGRKPKTDLDIIDECDEFLDSFSSERKININRLEGRKKSKIIRILRLLLIKLVCRSVEFLTWEFSILL